jgi:hypothetical protein
VPRFRTLLPSAFIVVIATVLSATTATESLAANRWHGSRYSFQSGQNCDPSYHIDPIGVIFTGPESILGIVASYILPPPAIGGYYRGDLEFHTGWFFADAQSQDYLNYGGCYPADTSQVSSTHKPRYHIRLWQQHESSAPGNHQIAGTPHYDVTDRCGRDSVPPGPYLLPGGGSGSGFDLARRTLLYDYRMKTAMHHHYTTSHFWGNNQHLYQCGRQYTAHSNGYVDIITIGKR